MRMKSQKVKIDLFDEAGVFDENEDSDLDIESRISSKSVLGFINLELILRIPIRGSEQTTQFLGRV